MAHRTYRPRYSLPPYGQSPTKPHIRLERDDTGPVWVVYWVTGFPIEMTLNAARWIIEHKQPDARATVRFGDPR